MTPLDFIAAVLFVLPIADWVAAVILLASAHNQHIASLTERSRTAVILAVCASIVAVFAWARLAGTRLNTDVAVLGLVVVMIGISVPALNWLRLLIRGGFR